MGNPRYGQHRPDDKMINLIEKIQKDLADSLEPVTLTALNGFERKQIHRFFDNKKDFVTKTYRHGEDFELYVYPVGNLRRYAEQKADEAIKTGKKLVLPHLNNYQRFVIHEALKTNDAIKSLSQGEGEDRHIEIEPVIFGRGLKRIIRKIKLF
jgi:predicted RNA-binding protein Jag